MKEIKTALFSIKLSKEEEAGIGWKLFVMKVVISEDLFSIVLSQEEAEDIVKEVSGKEIKEAMFDIRDNRAPGPDGYSSLFFKKA
ncbi:hypothetical protein Tco_0394799 [Tanacetum coccineum]